MTILEFWLTIAFVLSFFAYLSFSMMGLNVAVILSQPPEKKKEDFRIKPLSRLFKTPERLLAIVNFAGLLFVIPCLLLAYRWSSQFGGGVIAGALISLILLIFLLPEWLLNRVSASKFQGTVSIICYLFYPLFWLLSKLTPEDAEPSTGKSVEEKKANGEDNEEEETEELEFKGDIIKAISDIGETTVREVMTPRVDMICIPDTTSLEELHQAFKEHKFSRLPVYREKIDHVIGIVNMIDLVIYMPNLNVLTPVTEIMRPAHFVPETKKVFSLLIEFRQTHNQMAIVIDEYGGTSGLVTMEDLIEEIVGDIEDEHDERPFDVKSEPDGTYIVPGKFPIERLEEIFEMEIPSEDFETISGLIFSTVGRIPMIGETVRYRNLDLEIMEADKRRIHKVRIRPLPKEEDAGEVI